MFLVLLLFAVQVLFNLYATSVVTAAAYDAARMVAASGGAPDADVTARAEAHARDVLGRYGEQVTFRWHIDDREVALDVAADNRNFFFRDLPLDAIQTVRRTVRARVECFREAESCRRP